MDVTMHLHRGDGTSAYVKTVESSNWFTVTTDEGSDITLFIPHELVADAEAFAQSISAYCQKRRGALAL
jgi:hypothetical protein